MFLVWVFDVLVVWVRVVVVKNMVDGRFEDFYELFDYIEFSLLLIFIYVFGFEVLLYDV